MKGKVTGNCRVCGVIWEPKEDKQFVKGVRKQMRKWIGCDQKGCTYWEHATCAGLVLIPGKPASDHDFICIIHKAWKSKGYLDQSFIVSFVCVNTVVLKRHSCKKDEE